MNRLAANVTAYTIQLNQPLHITGHTIHERHIAGVTLTDETEQIGYGEVSPLPGLHRETFDRAFSQLRTVVDEINQTSVLPVSDTLYPSVQWGLDMAVRNKILSSMSDHKIRLNALVWADDVEQINDLLAQGYTCLKLKVGRQDVDGEIHRVTMFREQIRDRAILRLDANRLWSLDQAVRFGSALGPDGIEYMEEPTMNPADQAEFYRKTHIPFAWDESLLDYDLYAHRGLAALVIKPACLGSLETVEHWIAWAKRHGKQAVISSVFESCRSLLFYARYCVAKDVLETCHGLDTWRWLKDDPYKANLRLTEGSIAL